MDSVRLVNSSQPLQVKESTPYDTCKKEGWDKLGPEGLGNVLRSLIREKEEGRAAYLLNHFSKIDVQGCLHLAAEKDCHQIIPKLLEHCNVNEIRQGRTALYVAIQHGQAECVKELVKSANLSISVKEGRLTLWPVDYAVMCGELECLKKLLVKQKLSAQKAGGLGSPLHLAVQFGRAGVVDFLLKQRDGIRLLEGKNNKGQTPLIVAAAGGDSACVQRLCRVAKNINAKDAMGRTALHWAALGRHRYTISILLDCGADIKASDGQAKTPAALLAGAKDEAAKGILALLNNLSLAKKIWLQRPRNLVLKGAGWDRIAHALTYLEKREWLSNVRRVVGVGETILIATLYACGYLPGKALVLCKTPPKDLQPWLEKLIANGTKKSHSTLGEIGKELHLVARARSFSRLEEPDLVVSYLAAACFSGRGKLFIKRSNGELAQLNQQPPKRSTILPIKFFDEERFVYFGSKKRYEIYNSYTLALVALKKGEHIEFSKYDEKRMISLRPGRNSKFIAKQAIQKFLVATRHFLRPPAALSDQESFDEQDLVEFVGRKSHLQKLKKSLFDEWEPMSSTIVCVLCGVGGVGKTEIASRFVCLNKTQFSFVKWIPENGLLQALHDLADSLDIEIGPQDDIKIKIYHALENRKFAKPWLLIFDNLEQVVDLPKKGGAVLITSQQPKHWPQSTHIPVEPFSDKEAVVLLETITGSEDEKNCKTLVNRLGRLPLLISQAAASIANANATVKDYSDHFKVSAVINTKGTERHEASLQVVWKMTEIAIKKEDPLALELLKLFAYVNPDDFPFPWVYVWLRAQQKPRGECQNVVSLLTDYRLIKQNGDHLSIHRSLQKILQMTYQSEAGVLGNALLTYLLKGAPDNKWLVNAKAIVERIDLEKVDPKLLVQVYERIVKKAKVKMWIDPIAFACALDLHKRAEDQQRINRRFADRGMRPDALSEVLVLLGWGVRSGWKWLTMRKARDRLYQEVYGESLRWLKTLLIAQERENGKDHPQLIKTLTSIGKVHIYLKQLRTGLDVGRRAYALCQKHHKQPHKETVKALCLLGDIRFQEKKYNDSLACLRRALDQAKHLRQRKYREHVQKLIDQVIKKRDSCAVM